MEIILLEDIKSLGEFGAVVKVKPGYARNYLLPQGKALFASKQAVEEFADKRAEYLERAQQLNLQLQAQAEKLSGVELKIVARTVDGLKLYGSIAANDIVKELAEQGLEVKNSDIKLENGHIRETGVYHVPVAVSPDLQVEIVVEISDSTPDHG